MYQNVQLGIEGHVARGNHQHPYMPDRYREFGELFVTSDDQALPILPDSARAVYPKARKGSYHAICWLEGGCCRDFNQATPSRADRRLHDPPLALCLDA